MSTALETTRAALAANGFDVYLVADAQQAKQIFFSQILPELQVKTFSWGGSMTIETLGVLDELLQDTRFEAIKPFNKDLTREEIIELRRQGLLADLFLTGSNAVTSCGKLVNLDMIGNRTAAISFGPKQVVVFVGKNKISADLPAAMDRVRNVAAPLNTRRLDLPNPCAKTGRCHDCSSPKRICNTWTITEKSFPPKRIKVVLIDQDLGF